MSRITRLALALALVASLALEADSAILTTGAGNAGIGTFVPPSCTNSLDFTQACNSQYITVITFP